MMRQYPSMARMHEQMMRNSSEVDRAHDQMMRAGRATMMDEQPGMAGSPAAPRH